MAYTPELDIASAGSSENSARKHLIEAINIVLEGAKEDNHLEQFLREAGFSTEEGKFKAPKIVTEKVSILT